MAAVDDCGLLERIVEAPDVNCAQNVLEHHPMANRGTRCVEAAPGVSNVVPVRLRAA